MQNSMCVAMYELKADIWGQKVYQVIDSVQY